MTTSWSPGNATAWKFYFAKRSIYFNFEWAQKIYFPIELINRKGCSSRLMLLLDRSECEEPRGSIIWTMWWMHSGWSQLEALSEEADRSGQIIMWLGSYLLSEKYYQKRSNITNGGIYIVTKAKVNAPTCEKLGLVFSTFERSEYHVLSRVRAYPSRARHSDLCMEVDRRETRSCEQYLQTVH